jgi:hypothetical protein
MEIKQGDIYWIDLGEPKDSEPGYRHPHIIPPVPAFTMPARYDGAGKTGRAVSRGLPWSGVRRRR